MCFLCLIFCLACFSFICFGAIPPLIARMSLRQTSFLHFKGRVGVGVIAVFIACEITLSVFCAWDSPLL